METQTTENKREQKKSATREQIIRTATRIYTEQGFNTPTSVIAKEAGVSHGALFAHFPTREVLILALLVRFLEEVGGRLHILSETGGITDMLNAHIEFLSEHEDFYRRLISETSLLPDEANDTVVSMQSIVANHFLAVLEKRRAVIKPLPHHLIFNAWLGLIHYYLQNKKLFAPEGSVLKRYRQELVRSFRTLITA